jgi:hypothetical protein
LSARCAFSMLGPSLKACNLAVSSGIEPMSEQKFGQRQIGRISDWNGASQGQPSAIVLS